MISAIAFAALLTSCESFEHLTMITEESYPKAEECGKCHVDIYHEWKESDHAKAYTNPHFSRSTNNYAFDKCLSCHAPEPFVTETPLVTRELNRNEGITCVSCHLKEGKLSGPIKPTGKVAPHPVDVAPAFYSDSGLCGKCHKVEYSQWKSVDDLEKQSCQDCHMPGIRRKVTQPTGGISNLIVAMEKEVLVKKHDFSITSSNSQISIISITASRKDSNVSVSIKNILPHSLPTGDFGFRILNLKISSIDTQGKQTVVDQRELSKELKTAIDALSMIDLELDVPDDCVSLRVQLDRQSYEDQEIVYLADMEAQIK